MSDPFPIDLANEAYLLAHGWTHCRCKPPRNWARDDSAAIMCWPIEWALEEQARREREVHA